MSDTKAHRAFEEFRLSVRHLQSAGELLGESVREGARSLLARRRELRADAQRQLKLLFQAPARTGRLARLLNEQVVKLPTVASPSKIAELDERIARVEARLTALDRTSGANGMASIPAAPPVSAEA